MADPDPETAAFGIIEVPPGYCGFCGPMLLEIANSLIAGRRSQLAGKRFCFVDTQEHDTELAGQCQLCDDRLNPNPRHSLGIRPDQNTITSPDQYCDVIGMSNTGIVKLFILNRLWKELHGKEVYVCIDFPGWEEKMYESKLNPARRSIWSEHLLTLTNRLVTPKRWLAECIANHKDCANLVGYSSCYPKRLLDLQLSGSADNPNSGIKLINSNTIHGRPTYATLSHCWGISPQHNQGGVLKTTRVTQRQHEDGIPLASLPKTFLDAVILASELSIPYLWIDSLCIIQDDTACWESEAADMAAYYQNSHLTIAATSAKDSSEGCYLTITNHDLRVPLPPRNHNTQNRGTQSHHVRFAMRWIDRAQGFISHSLSSNSALSQRAWALQELVLSRRTIHCFSSQFYWNCRHHSESEDGSMTLEGLNPVYARYTSPRFSGSVPEFLELAHWHSLVERYIVSVLTFERDRLAAFAGITKHFQAHLGDEPMLGAWKRTAAFDLHWRRWHPKMEVPYTLAAYGVSSYPQIPSWSWLTVRPHPDPTSRAGRIVFLIYAARTLGTPLAFHYTTHTQVVAYEESWSGHPMTSTLAYADLTIQGPLIPIRSLPTREQGANVQYHLDDPRDNDDEGLLCLHLYGIQVTCSEGTRKEYFRWFMGFLLVRIVLQEPLTCRRIGAAMIETQGSPWLAWLCGAENQVIRMV